MQVMLRTFDDLGYRQEQRLHLELGLVKLVHLQRLVPIEEILSGLPATTSAPITTPRTATSAPRESSRTNATTSAVSGTPASGEFSPFETDRSRKMSNDVPSARAVAPIAPSNVTPINARSSSLGSLALSPDPVVPVAEPMAVVPPTIEGEPTPDNLSRAQQAACDALAHKLGMAAHALEESEWKTAGNELRIQTAQPKSMLSLVFTPDAERIIKSSLRASGLGAFKLVLLPGEPASARSKKPRTPRAGSVDAKAREHPMVRQALTLFNAEVLSVQDLRKD